MSPNSPGTHAEQNRQVRRPTRFCSQEQIDPSSALPEPAPPPEVRSYEVVTATLRVCLFEWTARVAVTASKSQRARVISRSHFDDVNPVVQPMQGVVCPFHAHVCTV